VKNEPSERARGSSEGVRVDKISGGIVPLFHRGIDPVEVAQDEGGGVEISPSKRRIDGSKSSGGLAKFRGSLDLGGGARRLNLRRGENPLLPLHIGESELTGARIVCA
jgi:hypothetical protein